MTGIVYMIKTVDKPAWGKGVWVDPPLTVLQEVRRTGRLWGVDCVVEEVRVGLAGGEETR